MSRGIALLQGLAIVAVASGCTAYRVETRPLPQVIEAEQPSVVRITFSDDRVVELYQPSVAQDSLRGHLTPSAVRRFSYPLASVQSAAIRRFHLGRTVLSILAIGGGIVVYDFIIGLNNTP